MPPLAKLMASGYGLLILIASASAASWSDMREAALAVGLGAASQLATWTVVPMTRSGMPPKSLVALEVAIGAGAVVASVFASAWFVLPAVIALATAASLTRARRVGPAPLPPEAVSATPTEAPPPGRKSVRKVRAAHPGVQRFLDVFVAGNLILAVLFAVAATAEPLMLVMAALFLAIAGGVKVGEWLWVRTTPPSVLRQLEQSRREHEATREARKRGA